MCVVRNNFVRKCRRQSLQKACEIVLSFVPSINTVLKQFKSNCVEGMNEKRRLQKIFFFQLLAYTQIFAPTLESGDDVKKKLGLKDAEKAHPKLYQDGPITNKSTDWWRRTA